ncbi:glycosyltransferase group 2 family protein [Prevotella sp. CAG:755]|nr:glycosyltransferase group 2 family protein [Prevotella sp. CAG:755]
MSSPTISVIVPVYNVAALLPRCIDSLLAQNFADYEVLLVDDGSTDGSEAIVTAMDRKMLV